MSDSERNLLKEKQSRIVNRVRCNVRRMPMLNMHLPMLNMHLPMLNMHLPMLNMHIAVIPIVMSVKQQT